jgi:hypothetical protein
MKRLFAICLCAVAFVLPPTPTSAHDGEVHKNLKGTVKSVSETSLAVIQAGEGTVTVSLRANTKYLRGTTPVTRTDLKVGERVVVGVSSAKDPYVAVIVRLAEAVPPGLK